ncbi:MAG: arsenite efflux transporter metallochaperone ArsD [Methanoregulaceae archaeon]|nr:arsenite efflux transporter metallochaperone ArsD [Methanoregulaceae archaeon]
MKTLKIYDPAMCCSTGVCGPTVDPKLVRLAADVAFLKSRGITVERFNLGHQPQAFAESPAVLAAMGAEAEHLPIFMVDGQIKATGSYSDRMTLAAWFNVEVPNELRLSPAGNRRDNEGC